MAKTEAEVRAAVEEIAAVCQKHGIYLVGTCSALSILGQITILEKDDLLCHMDGAVAYSDVDNHVFWDDGARRITAIG